MTVQKIYGTTIDFVFDFMFSLIFFGFAKNRYAEITKNSGTAAPPRIFVKIS